MRLSSADDTRHDGSDIQTDAQFEVVERMNVDMLQLILFHCQKLFNYKALPFYETKVYRNMIQWKMNDSGVETSMINNPK